MHTPLISIVIPTFARPRRLRECLQGIAGLRAEGVAFEVVVVDDGSPDSLAAVVAEFADRVPVTLVEQERGGPGSARNTGAGVARGRYLAFLDDDCRPASDWLEVLVGELDRDATRLLGGRVENALTDNPYSETSEWIGQFVYEYNRSPSALEPFFTTSNIALSADLFTALGGFTTAIPSATAEDKDFCDRWRASGLPLSPAPAAVVYHAHDLSLRRFVRQHFNYGRGILAFRVLRRSRAQSPAAVLGTSPMPDATGARRRIVPEPLSFYVRLLLSPMGSRPTRRRGRLMALLVVSQLATIAGALREVVTWRLLARRRARAPEA